MSIVKTVMEGEWESPIFQFWDDNKAIKDIPDKSVDLIVTDPLMNLKLKAAKKIISVKPLLTATHKSKT